jgi:hypothetical protein
MSVYWTMPPALKPFYETELAFYESDLKRERYQDAWERLERAHVLGQSWFIQHSYVHWKMLLFGIRIKSGKEILGQIPRLLLGGVKSFVGKIPVGNTGGANVPPMRRMEIPADLKLMLSKSKLS